MIFILLLVSSSTYKHLLSTSVQLQEDRDLGAPCRDPLSVGQSDRRPAFTVQTKCREGTLGALEGQDLGLGLVSRGSCNKDHKLGGLKQQIYTSSEFWRPEIQKSRCRQGGEFPRRTPQGVLGGPEEAPPYPSFLDSWRQLAVLSL